MSAAPKVATSSSRLVQPLKLGDREIHRVAMAPLTRMRAEKGTQIPSPHAAEYYSQRATEGGLILSEATFVAEEAAGYPMAPGIYSQPQIQAWKKITDAVHAKGGVMWCQLWALGRANLGEQEGVKTVSASNIPLSGDVTVIPREMTKEDIARFVGHYRQAALNAIESGFDGVEIHNANGYLPDQFLQAISNQRTDSYGGSLENRARFSLEVLSAVVSAVGQEKVGIRFSPWGSFQDMGGDANPFESFGYITRAVVRQYPSLGYVHFVEPLDWTADWRTNYTASFSADGFAEGVRPSNDYFRAIVRGIDPETLPKDLNSTVFPEPDEKHSTLFLSASGFKGESAISHSERTGDVVVFGRYFISTPDLVDRIKTGKEFNQYDRNTFYSAGPKGYTDYPTATQVESGKIKAQT